MICKCSINPITNLYTVYSHSYMRQYSFTCLIMCDLILSHRVCIVCVDLCVVFRLIILLFCVMSVISVVSYCSTTATG
jgi:hypothetical protein